MKLDRKKILNSIINLEIWFDNNGFAGYDPYDIRGQNWYKNLFGYQNIFFKKVRGLLYLIERILPPIFLRKILFIKPQINAKGMGLIASAYLQRFKKTKDEKYLLKSEEVLFWLSNNFNLEYEGMSWGYPFHWQSRIFFPKGTPSSVVTGTVGDAFLDHYELTKNQDSLNKAIKIAEFFLKSINCSVENEESLCFSYTPMDTYLVLNASLFTAAFLARLNFYSPNYVYRELAIKAAKYVISEQNKDGSFNYWGGESDSIIDHYHTGFVLRHLYTISISLNADFIKEPLKKGYNFYLEHMFTNNGIPKYTPNSLYPINIHSCSEAILTLTTLNKDYGGNENIDKTFNFLEEQMNFGNGNYLYAINKYWWGQRKIKIAYSRWGQAWIYLALTKLENNI